MVSFLANSWLALVLAMIAGYLLGSINWAIIVTRLFSWRDIRQEGSGNAGATNMLRVHGKLPAALTAIGDVSKSVLAALVGGWLLTHIRLGEPMNVDVDTLRMIGGYVGGFCSLLGHDFPVFYGFRGGKGVLSTLGMFLVLDWRIALLCLGIFVVIVAISRMVSLGSVLAIGCGPLLLLIFGLWVDRLPVGLVVFTVVFGCLVEALIVWQHRANLRRIANGTESRLGQKAHNNESQEK